jgi:hypothetical protein
LLSIVTQAFALVVFICLCAGEDLPPSFGDAKVAHLVEPQYSLLASELALSWR